MRYTVQSGVGVGAIRFGMSPDAVRERLGDPDESGIWEATDEAQDWWLDDGLSVLYDRDGVCAEIVLFPPATAKAEGRLLLGPPEEETRAALRELDPAATEDEGIVVSARFGLALSRDEEGEPELIVLAPGRLDAEPPEREIEGDIDDDLDVIGDDGT